MTQTVVHLVPGRAIVWRRPGRDADADADAHQLVQVVLTPREDGTLVQLRRDWPGRGITCRLARPLLVRMVRTHLRVQLHGIAQAAA